MTEPQSPGSEEPLPEEQGSSSLEKAAMVAAALLRHKELVLAAMQVLRERNVLTEEQEVKVFSAYARGDAVARGAIEDLLQKLQVSSLGRAVVDLAAGIKDAEVTPQTIRGVAQPYFAAAKEAVHQEARPYIERARQRLMELKTMEEPTLRRLEAVGVNLKSASQEVAQGLKGVGREAADELLKRGKRFVMSAETEELEREFLDWTLKNLPKAEQTFVRMLFGGGFLLLLAGVLVAAREFDLFKEAAVFVSIFLLIFLGMLFLSWGIKISEGLKGHRSDIEKLALMSPRDRRIYLTQRWAKRAQEEGVITSTEAETVIQQTIHAEPEEDAVPPTNTRDPATVP